MCLIFISFLLELTSSTGSSQKAGNGNLGEHLERTGRQSESAMFNRPSEIDLGRAGCGWLIGRERERRRADKSGLKSIIVVLSAVESMSMRRPIDVTESRWVSILRDKWFQNLEVGLEDINWPKQACPESTTKNNVVGRCYAYWGLLVRVTPSAQSLSPSQLEKQRPANIFGAEDRRSRLLLVVGRAGDDWKVRMKLVHVCSMIGGQE